MKAPVVVIGAGGGVGTGVAEALIAAGHSVIAVGRNADRLEALARRINQPDRLALLPGSIGDTDSAAALAASLRELRLRFAGMVISVGAARESGRLVDRPAQFLLQSFEQDVLTHFLAGQNLLPMLAATSPNALYLTLSCGVADFPWAGYGQVSVGNAALKMLAQVIRDEAKELPLRIQQLMICAMVRTHLNTRCACPEWVEAADVGREIVSLIESSNGLAPIIPFSRSARAARS